LTQELSVVVFEKRENEQSNFDQFPRTAIVHLMLGTRRGGGRDVRFYSLLRIFELATTSTSHQEEDHSLMMVVVGRLWG